jgi:hypothetical protein
MNQNTWPAKRLIRLQTGLGARASARLFG